MRFDHNRTVGPGRPRLAFTLIELLVVISIISVLIAILLPALKNARTSAQAMQSASNQRQILLSLLMYTHDYQGYFPNSYYRAQQQPSSPQYFWSGILWGGGYTSNWETFFAPTTDYGPSHAPDLSHNDGRGSTPWAYPSYAINNGGITEQWYEGRKYIPANLDKAASSVSPSEWIALRDVWNTAYADRDYGWYRFTPTLASDLPPAGGYYGNNAVVGYVDGHVDVMTTDELSDLTYAYLDLEQSQRKDQPPFYYHKFVIEIED